MNAGELYKAGRLADATAAQLKEVKANPADAGRRLFLFELLAFAGDLDRARRQIETVNYGEAERDAAVAAYRKLLDAEAARRRLFADGLAPQFFADPPGHVRLRLEAVNRLREGRPGEAAEVLNRANAEAAVVKGTLNGKAFESVRDADDLFAAVLEVMAHGVYYWVPLEQVEAVTLKAPKYPRDLLWAPARLEMREQAGDVFLPAVYPLSHEQADEALKLGRATDWRHTDTGPVLGAGARMFLVGDDDVGLLEWREFRAA